MKKKKASKKKASRRRIATKARLTPEAKAERREIENSARYLHNKKIDQAVLRDRVRATNCLNRLVQIEDDLIDLGEEVSKMKRPQTPQLQKSRLRADILKMQADMNFRKLAKVMPDTKAVEISDPDGNAVPIVNLTVNGKPTSLFDLPKEADIVDTDFEVIDGGKD